MPDTVSFRSAVLAVAIMIVMSGSLFASGRQTFAESNVIDQESISSSVCPDTNCSDTVTLNGEFNLSATSENNIIMQRGTAINVCNLSFSRVCDNTVQIEGKVEHSGSNNHLEQAVSSHNNCEKLFTCVLSGVINARISDSGNNNGMRQSLSLENKCGPGTISNGICEGHSFNDAAIVNSKNNNAIEDSTTGNNNCQNGVCVIFTTNSGFIIESKNSNGIFGTFKTINECNLECISGQDSTAGIALSGNNNEIRQGSLSTNRCSSANCTSSISISAIEFLSGDTNLIKQSTQLRMTALRKLVT